MDAHPILARVASVLTRYGLDAVLIGNAAAALHGAPVTTIDLDFMFRRSPANLRKLKMIARELDAVLMKPYYPASPLLRLSRDADGLQVDFMDTIDGIRSFEGLRNRAVAVQLGESRVLVAALADIIRSKKAAGRPQDLAVLGILEKLLGETSQPESQTRRAKTRK